MKKTARFLSAALGLCLLAGCGRSSEAPLSPAPSEVVVISPPAFSPEPEPTAAPEALSSFFFRRPDGKSGVLRSDGTFSVPCQYDSLWGAGVPDRYCAGKYPAAGTLDKDAEPLYALLDQNGQPLTKFLYSSLDPLGNGAPLLVAIRAEDSARLLLDAQTGAELLECPKTGWMLSLSGETPAVLFYDYEAQNLAFYRLDDLFAGTTAPCRTLSDVSDLSVFSFWEGVFAMTYADRAGGGTVLCDFDGPLFGEKRFAAYGYPSGEENVSLLALQERGENGEDGLWGYWNRKGECVIAPAFSSVGSFFGDVAAAADEAGLWGTIDTAGQWLVSPRYDSIGSITLGYALGIREVVQEDGSTSNVQELFDPDGNVLLSGTLSLEAIGKEYLFVISYEEDKSCAYTLDRKSGTLTALPGLSESDKYMWCSYSSGSRCVIEFWNDDIGSNCGIYDLSTSRWVVAPGKYHGIALPYSALTTSGTTVENSKVLCAAFRFHNNILYNLIDWDGAVLGENFARIEALEGSFLLAQKGFSYGLMDLEGNWIYRESIFSAFDDE